MNTSNPKRKHLNLDDVFQVATPIVVTWGGRDYEMTRPQYMSAKQLMGFNALRENAAYIQKKIGMANLAEGEHSEVTDSLMAEMEEMICQAVEIISPKFPIRDIPLFGKMRVMQFYGDQTKAVEPPKDNETP